MLRGTSSFDSTGINGSLFADSNPHLRSLTLHCNCPDVNQIILRNLSNFEFLAAPSMTGGLGGLGLDLEDLPVLERVEMNALYSANALRFQNLPKLRRVSISEPPVEVYDNIDIYNVAHDTLDCFTQTYFLEPNYVVDDIPSIRTIKYQNFGTSNFSINRYGNLSLVFECSACGGKLDGPNDPRNVSAENIEVAGLGSMLRNHTETGYIKNLTVGKITASKNSFTTLPFDYDTYEPLYCGQSKSNNYAIQ